MPWNGLGTFILDPSFSPEVNGTIIDAVRYNGLTTDIAVGITATLNKNGENVPTADIPWGGFKITGLGVATAVGDALSFGQEATFSWAHYTGTADLAVPPLSVTQAFIDSKRITWYASTQPADMKTVEWLWNTGTFKGRFVNDIYSLATGTFMQVTPAAGGEVGFIDFGGGDNAAHEIALRIQPIPGSTNYITVIPTVGGNPAIGTNAGMVRFTSGVRAVADITTANDVVADYTLLSQRALMWIDKDQPANGRQAELAWDTGVFTGRFLNDAYSAARNWLTVTGTSATQPAITLDGAVTITGGLNFGGTAFSNYTQGTFTPTVTGVAGVSYTAQVGKYTRIGNIVHFVINIAWINGTNGASIADIAGLPFASAAQIYPVQVIPNTLGGGLTWTGIPYGYVGGGTVVNIGQAVSGSTIAALVNPNAGTKDLYISGTYLV